MMTEGLYLSEAEAHTTRHALISAGYNVTPIVYDSIRELFAFECYS